MTKLNKAFLNKNNNPTGLNIPIENWYELPEKVLQFGTGVLLRGLPDYFIDKANREGIFNGRIVVVKSTDKGGTDEFSQQDNLYTLHVKGIEDGSLVQESVVVSSISRVLSAAQQWSEVMDFFIESQLEVIVSNTTEVGIVLDEDDDLNAMPPVSFPAKLTTLLFKRFLHFKGDKNKGLVILPTELISDNGTKLKEIVIKLSRLHKLGEEFVRWLDEANYFCNTLVDRIVPGRLPVDEQKKIDGVLGYIDDLAIMAEPFRLWAIESSEQRVIEVLSFAKVDKGIVIAPDIWKFKELKLRLLNGSHTFLCGLAVLSGFATVKDAMENKYFADYLRILMQEEIIPTIISRDISENDASDFASSVVDRFSNPFLNHQWLSIGLNYTSKMQMRNVALIEGFANKKGKSPEFMALGFAAYIRFMRCELSTDGKYIGNAGYGLYTINDDQASLFADLWASQDPKELVNRVLGNRSLWKEDLNEVPGLAIKTQGYLQLLLNNNAIDVIQQLTESPENLITKNNI